MLSRRTFLSTLALSSVGLPGVLAGLRGAVMPLPQYTPVKNLHPKTIAIVGDIQGTLWVEGFAMAREQNGAATKRIVSAIVQDKPDMILLLGDQVTDGSDETDWKLFDDQVKPITDANIPVYALRGNHDYGIQDRNPRYLRSFYNRFSGQSREMPEVITLGDITLVALDSNFDMLSPSDYQNQQKRYTEVLDKLEADPKVKGIIVASHHPPYTNSSLGPDYGVIAQFAQPFLKARKTRLYLSGHVHSYERFVVQDKMFVISGGGGGPRRDVSIASDRPFKNDAYRSETLRPFNYLRLHVNETSLDAEVMMLRKLKGKDEMKFMVGDRFSVGLYGMIQTAAEEVGPAGK